MNNYHWLGLSLSGAVVAFVLGWFDLWRGSMAMGFVATAEKIVKQKNSEDHARAWRSAFMLIARGSFSLFTSVVMAFVAGEYDACIRNEANIRAVILQQEERLKAIREKAERDVAAQAWRGRDGQR